MSRDIRSETSARSSKKSGRMRRMRKTAWPAPGMPPPRAPFAPASAHPAESTAQPAPEDTPGKSAQPLPSVASRRFGQSAIPAQRAWHKERPPQTGRPLCAAAFSSLSQRPIGLAPSQIGPPDGRFLDASDDPISALPLKHVRLPVQLPEKCKRAWRSLLLADDQIKRPSGL